MPQKSAESSKIQSVSEERRISKALAKKLKLDEKVIGLLVHSQGSVKDKGFAERVKEAMNRK